MGAEPASTSYLASVIEAKLDFILSRSRHATVNVTLRVWMLNDKYPLSCLIMSNTWIHVVLETYCLLHCYMRSKTVCLRYSKAPDSVCPAFLSPSRLYLRFPAASVSKFQLAAFCQVSICSGRTSRAASAHLFYLLTQLHPSFFLYTPSPIIHFGGLYLRVSSQGFIKVFNKQVEAASTKLVKSIFKKKGKSITNIRQIPMMESCY